MKSFRLLLSILCCFLIIEISNAQTRLVVNNNPGAPTGTNVYTTYAAAESDATTNDIIYIVPSSINYGDITVSKSVTIFGAGMIPDKDLGIKTFVENLNILASNVRVSGVIGTGYWSVGSGATGATYSNITIENCRFPGFRHLGSSVTIGNFLVRNCVITAGESYIFELQTTSSVIITNNVIMTYCCSSSYGINANGVTFSHNIFRYQGTSGNDGNTFENVDNSLFEFNIFYGTPPGIPSGSINNTFNYNVSHGSSVNTFSGIGSDGNTGTGNVTGDPLFADLDLGSTWSDSYDFTPNSGSPALDIDGSGTTAGVTGGATPWDADGSLLPTVQTITIPSVIPVGTDLNVNVTGKGN